HERQRARARAAVQRRERRAADQHAARVGTQRAGRDAEQCRLAGAVAAEQPDDLAGREREVGAAEHRTPAERDRDAFEYELRAHATRPRRCWRRNSTRKIGPPASAVIAPTGSSRPPRTLRAAASQTTRNAAPASADAGTSRRWSG